MFYYQDLGFNAPAVCQPAVILDPMLVPMQQATNYMRTINGYVDAAKKYQELYAEHFENSMAYNKWYLLAQRKIEQISNIPNDSKDINWALIPKDLLEFLDYVSMVTGWHKFPLLVSALGYINAAMRGRYLLQIHSQWTEAIITYILMIAPRGQLKSRVHQILIEPFEIFQEKHIDRYNHDKKAETVVNTTLHQAKSMAKTALLKTAMKEASTEDGGIDIKYFFAKARAYTDEFMEYFDINEQQLADPSLLADGFTQKKLIRRMEMSGGGQAILQPEGTTLVKAIKDSKFDPKFFTKSHGMESLSDDTVTGGRIKIDKPFLNIVLFVQLGKVAELYRNSRLLDSGIVDRFIPFFAPRGNSPHQNPENLYDGSKRHYDQKIASMLACNFTQEKNREIYTVILDQNARQEIVNFRAEIKAYVDANLHVSGIEFLDKIAGTAARIAGILHAWQYDKPEQYFLSQQTAQVGIHIAKAILPHADHALLPSGFRAIEDAKKILDWVRRHRHTVFTSRDIGQGVTGMTNVSIFPALDLLEKHNILTQHITPKNPRLCLMHPAFA